MSQSIDKHERKMCINDRHTVRRAPAPSRLHCTPFGAVYPRSLSAFGVRHRNELAHRRN